MDNNEDISTQDTPDNKLPVENIEIDARILEEIARLSDNGRVQLLLTTFEHSSGPLPAPAILAGYDRVQPGTADRIVTVFESNVRHQQEMDIRQFEASVSYANKGQNRGFLLSVSGLVAGLAIVVMGFKSGNIVAIVSSTLTGSALSGVSILRLVSKFIDGPSDSKNTDNESN